ncbi:MAG: hypothetical protein JWN00_4851 [Actinomycetia bacterium]|nr:hypothetical protein [Actinomycetes bacterium]
MARWMIDEPTTLDFEGVVALKAGLVAGAISVVAGDERPSVRVSDVHGSPLTVTHEAGMLTIAHENVLGGILQWLSSNRSRATVTVMVPPDCPVTINLVTAEAVIAGLTARTSVRTGSGDVTLGRVTGRIDVSTVSGAVEAQDLAGTMTFNSVSGDLALAGGYLDMLNAKSVNGKIAADISMGASGQVTVTTVSGEVTLRLPAFTSAKVSLTSAAGRIDSAFEGLDRGARSVPKSLTGTLGDGAGQLTVNTVSGSVTLLSRSELEN